MTNAQFSREQAYYMAMVRCQSEDDPHRTSGKGIKDVEWKTKNKKKIKIKWVKWSRKVEKAMNWNGERRLQALCKIATL